MKSVKRSRQERRLERALLVIDGLCMGEEGPLFETIYMIAHAAVGRCGNPHKDWRKDTKEIEVKLKEANVVDAVLIASRPLR
jgi:hypothetical protein